ncbi:MAG TPA: SAF domain-containing protein [Acidimicrobiales bacterium]|nr:SAF domain-containing protein [Acidimicrobiales bacterium]
MRIRRSALPFWVLFVALAVLTGVTVARLVGEASARASRLGGLVDVAVAARPVESGAVVAAGDVTVRHLPADALPDAAVAATPVGKVALVPLVPGEVLLRSKLAPDGLRGVAALVPRGFRALAVPVEPGGLAVRLGDRVDVMATFDVAEDPGAPETAGAEAGPPAATSGAGPPTFPVAEGALVVDVGDEAVTVAVEPADAARVAFALARGTVALALTSP